MEAQKRVLIQLGEKFTLLPVLLLFRWSSSVIFFFFFPHHVASGITLPAQYSEWSRNENSLSSLAAGQTDTVITELKLSILFLNLFPCSTRF